jgi:transposase InsO family protein
MEPQDRRLELRPTLHASLVLAALHDALKRRRPPKGLLHHSDRGSQYVDEDYIKALDAAGIERSMSRAGNCYDNAAMESFWSTLKTDTGLDSRFPPAGITQSLPSSITSRRFTTRRGATARSVRSPLWPSKTKN